MENAFILRAPTLRRNGSLAASNRLARVKYNAVMLEMSPPDPAVQRPKMLFGNSIAVFIDKPLINKDYFLK